MQYRQKFTFKNHPLVFGVVAWHKIILGVCTQCSQNITYNISKGYVSPPFSLNEGQELL